MGPKRTRRGQKEAAREATPEPSSPDHGGSQGSSPQPKRRGDRRPKDAPKEAPHQGESFGEALRRKLQSGSQADLEGKEGLTDQYAMAEESALKLGEAVDTMRDPKSTAQEVTGAVEAVKEGALLGWGRGGRRAWPALPQAGWRGRAGSGWVPRVAGSDRGAG